MEKIYGGRQIKSSDPYKKATSRVAFFILDYTC